MLASELIKLVDSSLGERRSEIEAQSKAITLEKVNPKVIPGMQKILFDRSTFTHSTEKEPDEIREEVFTASADYWKTVKATPDIFHHKKNVLRKINPDSESAFKNTESWLFGDVAGNQKLISVDIITAEDLIHRFNIAQVQGLLLNAQDLEIKINRHQNATFRQVMQMLKFFRLMFEIRDQDENWLTIAIDGPGAILENRRSYGLELAQFFPAVILLSGTWQLQASVKRSARARKSKLTISDEDNYQTYYPKKRVWLHQKINSLIERINEKYSHQLIASHEQTILSLKNNRYLLPDFSIQMNPSEDRKKNQSVVMSVEWIPYLSESKIRWLRKILPELPENYIFAVKGKRAKLKSLIAKMGVQLLVYSNELTAPAIKKQIDLVKGK